MKLHVATNVDERHCVPLLTVKVRNLVIHDLLPIHTLLREKGMCDLFLVDWSDDREIIIHQCTLLLEEGAAAISFEEDIPATTTMEATSDRPVRITRARMAQGVSGTTGIVLGMNFTDGSWTHFSWVVDSFQCLSDEDATLTLTLINLIADQPYHWSRAWRFDF